MLKSFIKNTLRILFLCAAINLIGSCTSIEIFKVKVPNTEWCGDMGSEGAYCFNTLFPLEREISKEDWDKERLGMLCTTADSFSEMKKAILKLCRTNKRCKFEEFEEALRLILPEVELIDDQD